MMLRTAITLACVLTSASAAAQASAPPPTTAARDHFQTALADAQRGDLVAALREFEAAYAARPHYSVLYNIGQTRATLGRPVEAAAAFEEYLEAGGEKIDAARRREVEELLAAARNRTGRLSIEVSPEVRTFKVWLDGAELASNSLTSPIALASGEHHVVYAVHDGAPTYRKVVVRAQQVERLVLSAPRSTARDAQLSVSCEVPSVLVEVMGRKLATTPLAHPLLVPAGPLRVRFSRTGYEPVERSVDVRAGGLVALDCAQRPLSPLPPALSTRLHVETVPGALVTLDGQRYLGGPVPIGAHRLRVVKDGFISYERDVMLSAGATTRRIELQPTTRERARQHARRRRHTIGVVLGGMGLASVGAGIGTLAWSSSRYERWQSNRPTSLSENLEAVTSIQRADDLGFGLLALGIGLGASGAWFLVTTE